MATTLATTLRDRRKQQAMDEIAAVALELFARDGFAGTSVDDIAAAAGCSPRTFYRYFGSKEDVMFHDLPVMMERLGGMLDQHLADGLGPWAAVTEAFATLISRFDETSERIATERMNLWLHEPALRARYMQYVTTAEDVVADSLRRHNGTASGRDDLAMLIAVAATGAYRVTVLTHHPRRTDWKLAKHLREALATLATGLGDDAITT